MGSDRANSALRLLTIGLAFGKVKVFQGEAIRHGMLRDLVTAGMARRACVEDGRISDSNLKLCGHNQMPSLSYSRLKARSLVRSADRQVQFCRVAWPASIKIRDHFLGPCEGLHFRSACRTGRRSLTRMKDGNGLPKAM